MSPLWQRKTLFPLLLCRLAHSLSKELCSKNSGNTCQQKTWELCLNKCTCQLSRTVDFRGLKNVDYFKTYLMDNRNWAMEMRHGMCLESCLSVFFPPSFFFLLLLLFFFIFLLTLQSLGLVHGGCNVNFPLAWSLPRGYESGEYLRLSSGYLAKQEFPRNTLVIQSTRLYRMHRH